MERINSEIEMVEEAVAEALESKVRELNELQLAIVGGGVGEVVFH